MKKEIVCTCECGGCLNRHDVERLVVEEREACAKMLDVEADTIRALDILDAALKGAT